MMSSISSIGSVNKLAKSPAFAGANGLENIAGSVPSIGQRASANPKSSMRSSSAAAGVLHQQASTQLFEFSSLFMSVFLRRQANLHLAIAKNL